MKSDDILVLAALGGLAFVLIGRMRPAAAQGTQYNPTMPYNPAIPVGQQPSGSPYNPATVAGWLGLVGVVKDTVDKFGGFGAFNGHDYVSGIDSAPALVESSNAASEHDSIWVAGPDWLN